MGNVQKITSQSILFNTNPTIYLWMLSIIHISSDNKLCQLDLLFLVATVPHLIRDASSGQVISSRSVISMMELNLARQGWWRWWCRHVQNLWESQISSHQIHKFIDNFVKFQHITLNLVSKCRVKYPCEVYNYIFQQT